MERLNGLSLATQPISVKGGTRLLAIPYVNSHPLLQSSPEPVHRVPPFGRRVLLAGPCPLSCLIPAGWPPGTSSGGSSAPFFLLPGEMLVPGNGACPVEPPSTPCQTQLALGVRGRACARQGQVFFFVNSGQNGAPRCTVVLHSDVFNGK